MVICNNCGKELPETSLTPYCDDACTRDYLNSIRLFFVDDVRNAPTNILRESEIQLTKLVRYMDSSELALRIKIFISAGVQLQQLHNSLRARDEASARKRIREENALKGTKKITDTNKFRETEEIKRGVRLSGEKVGKTGKCAWCDSNSVAETCTVSCKNNYAAMKLLMKSSMTENNARAIIKASQAS